MSRQYFAEVQEPVMVADQTQITGTAETAMWPVSPFTSTVANQLRPGQAFRITAGGVTTTPGSAATTLTLTPRWGTTTGGTTLGASAASTTATASLTNVPWYLTAVFVCRAVGSSGSAIMTGNFSSQAIGANATGVQPLTFGGTVATIDTTTAQGFFFGATLGGSASWTLTTRYVVFEQLN